MPNFNLPLPPSVVSSAANQTGSIVGISNISGTLYNPVTVLDPAYIEANLALATAQTVFNFAHTSNLT